jgi:hypothetical protein
MDSILIKAMDRINRINRIFFRLSGRKPENSIAFGEVSLIRFIGQKDCLLSVGM